MLHCLFACSHSRSASTPAMYACGICTQNFPATWQLESHASRRYLPNLRPLTTVTYFFKRFWLLCRELAYSKLPSTLVASCLHARTMCIENSHKQVTRMLFRLLHQGHYCTSDCLLTTDLSNLMALCGVSIMHHRPKHINILIVYIMSCFLNTCKKLHCHYNSTGMYSS